MAKKQIETDQKQKNKGHKTLRQKLKKRRTQQKAHLKQKKQKRKLFNPQQQKKDFFNKHFSSQTQQKFKQLKKQFKYKKINKNIQKFINIYEDDLEDFFEIFKQFDQGGFIDISGLQNLKLQKILKKLFKYLPLNININKNEQGKQIIQYRKKKQSKLNLQNIIRNLVTQCMQNYLQYGTDEQQKKQQSSDDNSDNQKIKIKKPNSKKQAKVNINKNQSDQQQGIFALPQQQYPKQQAINNFGPVITQQQRQKIAQMFQKQLLQIKALEQKQQQQQNDQFQKIFSMGTTVNKLREPIRKAQKKYIQQIPQSLYAQGSAKLGQKVEMLQQEENYDAVHRPRKLIDEHREIMAINRGETIQNGSNQNHNSKIRKPFDRDRDVVNSRTRFTVENMQNGVFFNFKDRMSTPKKTNNFL